MRKLNNSDKVGAGNSSPAAINDLIEPLGLSQATLDEKRVEMASLPPMALDKFITDSGLSPVTIWRYRKRGWLKTVNIAGRHYVPRIAIMEFNLRAAAGEFAQDPARPGKSGRG